MSLNPQASDYEVKDFAKHILKDCECENHPSAFTCVVIQDSDEAILLLYRGLVKIGEHDKEPTNKTIPLKCWNLDGWYMPPGTEGDVGCRTIGISVFKQTEQTGSLSQFWENKMDYATVSYAGKWLENKFLISPNLQYGFEYSTGDLTVRGHGPDIQAIISVISESENELVHLYENQHSFIVSELKKQKTKKISRVANIARSLKTGYKSYDRYKIDEDAIKNELKKTKKLNDDQPTLPDTTNFKEMEKAHIDKFQDVLKQKNIHSVEHSVARIYYTRAMDVFKNTDEVMEACISIMNEVVNFASDLSFDYDKHDKIPEALINHLKKQGQHFPETMLQEERMELEKDQPLDEVLGKLNDFQRRWVQVSNCFPSSESKQTNSPNFWVRFELFKTRFQLIHHKKVLQSSNMSELKTFKNFYDKCLWIFKCQSQLVQLLIWLFLKGDVGDNRETIASFLGQLLIEKCPCHLINQHNRFGPFLSGLKVVFEYIRAIKDKQEKMDSEKIPKIDSVEFLGSPEVKEVKEKCGEDLTRFFDKWKPGSKPAKNLGDLDQLVSEYFKNLKTIIQPKVKEFLNRCDEVGEEIIYAQNLNKDIENLRAWLNMQKEPKPLYLIRRDWLTVDDTVSHYLWSGVFIEKDPNYISNDTHVPLHFSTDINKEISSTLTPVAQPSDTVEEISSMPSSVAQSSDIFEETRSMPNNCHII